MVSGRNARPECQREVPTKSGTHCQPYGTWGYNVAAQAKNRRVPGPKHDPHWAVVDISSRGRLNYWGGSPAPRSRCGSTKTPTPWPPLGRRTNSAFPYGLRNSAGNLPVIMACHAAALACSLALV